MSNEYTLEHRRQLTKNCLTFFGKSFDPWIYRFAGNNCINLVRLTLRQAGTATSGQAGPRPYFESLPSKP